MSLKYAEHLSNLVRCETISNADKTKVNQSEFEKLHNYIEKAWPLLSNALEKQVLGENYLLYKWKGKRREILPVLLLAHQDVVPVGDVSGWKYSPFEGIIKDGYVWGRGASDCKSVLVSILEAVEELLQEGFEPDYDVYLGFADDEELQGVEKKGAQIAVDYLKEQGIRLGAVLDEGGGISVIEQDGEKIYIANVALNEKAYADYEIVKETEGGHAMRPGKGSGLGDVARGIVAIEDNPLPYKLTELVKKQLIAGAILYEKEKRVIFENPEKYWDDLVELAKSDASLDALLHTTNAVTMAYGSKQSNVLPERAGAVINTRILPGDKPEEIEDYLKKLLPVGVQLRTLAKEFVSLESSTEGKGYETLSEALINLYGQQVVIVPSLVLGGTDSRYFTQISNQVFRFTGLLQTNEDLKCHGIDEHFPYDAIEYGVRFYKEFIKQY
ncbi:MAG: M20/M25/M40 family metallo-hydrolase [Lachnospiraceae bacterium]|nr:M20/M25/M40 family metallo-hydrolase [Lachnospiraceae bacterium]